MTRLRLVTLEGVASLGGLLLSYNTVVISGTTVSLLTYFHLTKLQLAITTSSILWGTLLGTVAVGVWRHADPGRLLKWLALLFTLSALGSALAWTWAVLVAFRVLAGFAIGVSSVIVPAYLANLSPPEWRGRIVGLFQFNIGVGPVQGSNVHRVGSRGTPNNPVGVWNSFTSTPRLLKSASEDSVCEEPCRRLPDASHLQS